MNLNNIKIVRGLRSNKPKVGGKTQSASKSANFDFYFAPDTNPDAQIIDANGNVIPSGKFVFNGNFVRNYNLDSYNGLGSVNDGENIGFLVMSQEDAEIFKTPRAKAKLNQKTGLQKKSKIQRLKGLLRQMIDLGYITNLEEKTYFTTEKIADEMVIDGKSIVSVLEIKNANNTETAVETAVEELESGDYSDL